jgi:class 3 adenylate cyclase
VLADARSAGHAALRFQESLHAIQLADLGLPDDLGLRVSVHAGPILQRQDPVRGVLGWWGRELTRAARIEPRTPEGEVYATEAFAALIALDPAAGLACDYVGQVTTAKDFETIGLYRLRRVEPLAAASPRGA